MTARAARLGSPRQALLAVAAPILGVLAWHVATSGPGYHLIPPPWDVAVPNDSNAPAS